MNKYKITKYMALLAAGGLLAAGCEVRVHDRPGEVVATGSVGGEIDVEGPPPAPREETVIGVAPEPGYIWVGGEWGWHGHRWEWEKGRWNRPPRMGAHWTHGHYEMHGGRHVYFRGRWE